MDYIAFKVKYSRSFNDQLSFLQFLFCVLGNGTGLNLKGHIESYETAFFSVTDPVKPLTSIYPCSSKGGGNYHMRLAGCTNKGFKEAVQYLIDCILITPDSVDNIKDWKENIHFLEELRDHPLIKDDYATLESAREAFKKELETSNETTASRCKADIKVKPSVSKINFFDVQWSECPTFIEDEVRQMWRDCELGNDNYIYKAVFDDKLFKRYPRVYLWLEKNNVKIGERVIIHWWW